MQAAPPTSLYTPANVPAPTTLPKLWCCSTLVQILVLYPMDTLLWRRCWPAPARAVNRLDFGPRMTWRQQSLRMGRKAIPIYAYARKRAYGNLFPVFDLYFTENLKPTTTTRDDSGIFMYGIGKVKLLRNAHISRLLPLERYWTLCHKWSWNSTGTAYHTSHENKDPKK